MTACTAHCHFSGGKGEAESDDQIGLEQLPTTSKGVEREGGCLARTGMISGIQRGRISESKLLLHSTSGLKLEYIR